MDSKQITIKIPLDLWERVTMRMVAVKASGRKISWSQLLIKYVERNLNDHIRQIERGEK